MKLPIKVVGDSISSCLDNTIAAVSKWMNKSYELMYVNSWKCSLKDINFNKLNDGEKYFTEGGSSSDEKILLLEKYHGLKVTVYEGKSFIENKKNVINELNKQMPVTIEIDSFYCPWFKPKYRRVHSPHSCLVLGADEKGFWISDGQMAIEGDYLPYDEYSQGFRNFYTYSETHKEELNYSWNDILQLIINNFNKEDYDVFDSIRSFSKRMKNNIDTFKVWGQSGISEEFLVSCRSLKEVSRLIKFLYRKFGDVRLSQLYEHANVCSARWMSIYGMYIKTIYTPDSKMFLNRLCEKICDAANEDEKLYTDMVKMINCENKNQCKNEIHSNNVNRQFTYECIDISNHFNNVGFYKNLNDCIPSFSYGKRYYIPTAIPKDRIFKCDNMKFVIADFENVKYDNITCLGQEIEVKTGKYKQMLLLGAAELGDQVDNIYIYYNDYVQKQTIEFSTWRSYEPVFNEKIIWKGKSHCSAEEKVGMGPQDACIYGIICKLNSKKDIVKIKLPLCTNIHIFAITLCK